MRTCEHDAGGVCAACAAQRQRVRDDRAADKARRQIERLALHSIVNDRPAPTRRPSNAGGRPLPPRPAPPPPPPYAPPPPPPIRWQADGIDGYFLTRKQAQDALAAQRRRDRLAMALGVAFVALAIAVWRAMA